MNHVSGQPFPQYQRVMSLMPWIPAALVVSVLFASLVGIPVFGLATATTVQSINAEISDDVSLNASCAGAALTITALDPDRTLQSSGANCDMAIETQSPNGAELYISDAGAVPGEDAMTCSTPATCGTSTFPDIAGGTPGFPDPKSGFGARLTQISGDPRDDWAINFSGASTGAFYPVADTPERVCYLQSEGVGTCSVRFGAAAAPGTRPGTYEAQVLFEAVSQ